MHKINHEQLDKFLNLIVKKKVELEKELKKVNHHMKGRENEIGTIKKEYNERKQYVECIKIKMVKVLNINVKFQSQIKNKEKECNDTKKIYQ